MRSFFCFLTVAVVLAPPALADSIVPTPYGSFTFNWAGTAPKGANITLKVSYNFGGITTYFPFSTDVSGLTGSQAASNFLDMVLIPSGVQATLNGANSINVTSVTSIGGKFTVTDVSQLNTNAGFEAVLDGNVGTFALAPRAGWMVAFNPASVATVGGNLDLMVPTLAPLTTFLSAGTTAEQANQALFNMLIADRFPGVQCLNSAGMSQTGCLGSTALSFFLDPSGSPITSITAVSFDGAGLDYELTLPATATPEPASIFFTGLGTLTLVLYRIHASKLYGR
jgi:hypothetical protein